MSNDDVIAKNRTFGLATLFLACIGLSGFVYLNTRAKKVLYVSSIEVFQGFLAPPGYRMHLGVEFQVGFPHPLYLETQDAGKSEWTSSAKELDAADGHIAGGPIVVDPEKQERLKQYVPNFEAMAVKGNGHYYLTGMAIDVLCAIVLFVFLLVLFEALFRRMRKKSEGKNSAGGSA